MKDLTYLPTQESKDIGNVVCRNQSMKYLSFLSWTELHTYFVRREIKNLVWLWTPCSPVVFNSEKNKCHLLFTYRTWEPDRSQREGRRWRAPGSHLCSPHHRSCYPSSDASVENRPCDFGDSISQKFVFGTLDSNFGLRLRTQELSLRTWNFGLRLVNNFRPNPNWTSGWICELGLTIIKYYLSLTNLKVIFNIYHDM